MEKEYTCDRRAGMAAVAFIDELELGLHVTLDMLQQFFVELHAVLQVGQEKDTEAFELRCPVRGEISIGGVGEVLQA